MVVYREIKEIKYIRDSWIQLIAFLMLSCVAIITICLALLSQFNDPDYMTVVEPPKNVEELKVVDSTYHLVCYYEAPISYNKFKPLRLIDIKKKLCTHINVGVADVKNSSIILSDNLKHILNEDLPIVRSIDPNVKILLWIGAGGGVGAQGFAEMVQNHENRKTFIKSIKNVLQQYNLNGVDLDWEFPRAYNKQRQHFSQLLREIRAEYYREKKPYMLTVAVAATEGIALFAYDVQELNKYVDFVNLMSYDYHFYTPTTPFTGINSPLYRRFNEESILATFNINYSVNWWLANGLDRKKLVVGLPTYGHSFTLVNPLNFDIGAPASGIGHYGKGGFTTYTDVCFLRLNNLYSLIYDNQTCSPILQSGTDWISFENEISIECKAEFIKSENLGGAMMFSLNSDDFQNICRLLSWEKKNLTFPLIERVKTVLFN